MKPSLRPPPSECPVCGADVPRHAKSCPECGADERTGWDEDATRYDGLDLPEAEIAQRHPPAARNGLPLHWWWVGVALLALLALGLLARFVSR